MLQETRIVEDQVQVTLAGSFYAEEARAVEETLTSFIDQGQASFVIDFSQVDDIDNSGLGTLIHIQRRAVNNDVSIKIKGLQGRVKELFELTRLIKVFEIQQ